VTSQFEGAQAPATPDVSQWFDMTPPDELFPDIPADKRLRGTTRAARDQRTYLKQRETYIKLYEHVLALRNTIGLKDDQLTRERADYQSHLRTQRQRGFDQSDQMRGDLLAMVTLGQLGLLLQKRPTRVNREIDNASRPSLSTSIGDIGLVLRPGSSFFEAFPPQMKEIAIHTSTTGEILADELHRLVGYLVAGGYKLDSRAIRRALSEPDLREIFGDEEQMFSGMPGLSILPLEALFGGQPPAGFPFNQR